DPPAADQVMVQTLVSAISPGTELLFYRGQAPTDLPVDETIAALAGMVGFPLKYGYAAVGRVVAVGAQVAPEWQDRLVFSFHPHESHFLAAPSELMHVPASLSPGVRGFAHPRVTGALAPGSPRYTGPLSPQSPDFLSPGLAREPGAH